ncbi:RES domain-containing protein [Yersinia intermedia]|nr:RES domain-containing protein [Yersinia intermedia]
MMLYRIVMRRYLASTWTGYGAEIYGGRWNHKGHAAIYLASSVSLAMLETLVHIQDSSTLSEFELFQIEIDDSNIMLLQPQDWPLDWRNDPAPAATWISAQSGWDQNHQLDCWSHPHWCLQNIICWSIRATKIFRPA